jgi:hypothetical protein
MGSGFDDCVDWYFFTITVNYNRVSVRVTLRLAVYGKSVHLGAKPLETHDQYFLQMITCGYSPYVTSSLTRGWVCRLQLLLALARAVIFRSESRGTHNHILLFNYNEVKVRVILRLAVYHPSDRLCVRPVEAHDQRITFPIELLR